MAKVTKVCVGESLVGDGNEVAHVDLLIGPAGTTGYGGGLLSGGGTNWEDALHRAFYTGTGTAYSPSSATARGPSSSCSSPTASRPSTASVGVPTPAAPSSPDRG